MYDMSTSPRQTWGCEFLSENIQSGYFIELVQNNHMKVCASDNMNTGVIVTIDHFSNLGEAVPCHHDEYDATSTSRLLLQKWFARHGTPTRMQWDNAPNLTAEVANQFMKASQVTKVTFTPGHPRTQGLLERQNRTFQVENTSVGLKNTAKLASHTLPLFLRKIYSQK